MISLPPIVTVARILRHFENWPSVLADSLALSRRDRALYRLRNGLVFSTPTNKNMIGLFNEVMFENCYCFEPHEFLGKPSTVVDIGAHIGIFSVMVASSSSSFRVYSYEPSPYNFDFLIDNIRLNRLGERVYPRRQAVAGSKGKRVFFLRQETVNNSLYVNGTKDQLPTEVQSVTLGDVFEDNRLQKVDLLKMDCEDAEVEILEAADDATFEKIDRIAMEMRAKILPSVNSILRRHGYRVEAKVADKKRGLIYVYVER